MVLFPKHLGSLLTSIPNRFDPKNNPEKQVKSTLGMQQLNQQEFNNVLQKLHILTCKDLTNHWTENSLVCG